MKNENNKELNRQVIEKLRPHYVFNILWNIQYLYRTNPTVGEKMLMDFSSFLRGKINDACYDGLVPFEELFKYTRAYIEMEQVRASSPIELETKFDYVDFALPSEVIQPIIENSIKHGLYPKGQEGKIVVKTKKENEKIILVFEDNGVGFDINSLDRNKGSNLFYFEERIRKIYKDAIVLIESKVDVGTKITISFTVE